ncbi:MAG: hypothetical protein JWM36_4360 [Hyphomicrobiales bacterium]|nr:hypothetical protein [Hyphomicrobiales bacterium]
MSFAAQNWALEQDTGDPGSKLLLIILAAYSGADGSCFPGQDTLAKRTGCSERSVRTHLMRLEELGLIKRHERRRSTGSKSSDLIVLCMPTVDEPLELGAVTILPAKSAAGRKRQNFPKSPANFSKVTGNICRNIEDESVREPCQITPSDARAAPALSGGVDWSDFAEVFSPRSANDDIIKSRKAWAELSDDDRAQAVAHAASYCAEAKRAGREPMYSSGFLLTRQWKALRKTSAGATDIEWVPEGSDRWREIVAAGKSEALMRSMLRPHDGKPCVPHYVSGS